MLQQQQQQPQSQMLVSSMLAISIQQFGHGIAENHTAYQNARRFSFILQSHAHAQNGNVFHVQKLLNAHGHQRYNVKRAMMGQ